MIKDLDMAHCLVLTPVPSHLYFSLSHLFSSLPTLPWIEVATIALSFASKDADNKIFFLLVIKEPNSNFCLKRLSAASSFRPLRLQMFFSSLEQYSATLFFLVVIKIHLASAKFPLIESHSSMDDRSSTTMRHFCVFKSRISSCVNS
uniref:Uncharacterized protein n=1 Tax=Arundo donax TaxID=35708 RepID=A0A0A8XVM7_ARUDO